MNIKRNAFLLDTNILVVAVGSRKNQQKEEIARKLLQDKRSYVASRNIIEFTNVIASVYPLTSSKDKIKENIFFLLSMLQNRVLLEKSNSFQSAIQLFTKSKKSKKWFIFDCMITAIAIDHGIRTIYTENIEDFASFSKIKAVNPFI